MTASAPSKMRSLAAPKPCGPSGYEVMELPVPEIHDPDEVLIKVHAASLGASETQVAKGQFGFMSKVEFPRPLGMEGSGIVVAVGRAVTTLRPGDAVYGGFFQRPALPPRPVGFCSEYVVVKSAGLLRKPPQVGFEEAAALFGNTMCGYQSMLEGLALSGAGAGVGPDASLDGRTVFVPGALSGTGSVGVQLAKNVFGASKVVSSVSTAKVGLVGDYLPGVVDQVVDYKTQDLVETVGKGTVDFVYNTVWQLTSTFPLLKPETGVVVTIASVPPAPLLREILGPDNLPFFVAWIVTLGQWYYAWKLWGTKVKLTFVSGNHENREEVERVGEIIATGKVKAVMTVVSVDDLARIREECEKLYSGKGGLGRLVIKFT